MYRQEELSEIIDLQTNDFVHKPNLDKPEPKRKIANKFVV